MAIEKGVNVQLIKKADENGEVTEPYRIMDALIVQHHPHLADANIAIAWRFGWTEDADGRLRLGQCSKGSDLDRELHGFDFVILLNHEAWNHAEFTEKQRRMLIDHELCHAQVAEDEDGEVKRDVKQRIVYRIRKHDIEEFEEIVQRHGFQTAALESFAKTCIARAKMPLLSEQPKTKTA